MGEKRAMPPLAPQGEGILNPFLFPLYLENGREVEVYVFPWSLLITIDLTR